MNLVNLSHLEAGITLATDKHGFEHLVAVAKGTFRITDDGRCVPAEEPVPLVYADEHDGESGESSVRYESDFATRKPRADVVVNGSAYAPRGRPAESVDVSLQLGPIRKTVRVFGNRVWESSLLRGFVPSSPEPFEVLPLSYDLAFGGADISHDSPKEHVFERRNLVGVGLHGRLHDGIRETPLPNLETPDHLIRKPTDKPPPAGLGFVARGWLPRASYAGTYDDAWLQKRFPFLPLDFDDRYFHGAPEDQICDHLQGGQRVALGNLTPDGRLEFSLPTVNVPVRIVYRRRSELLDPVLDTLVVEPDQRRCMLTYRASARLEGKPTDVREIWVGTPTRGRLRALEMGKRYVGNLGELR